MNTSLNNSVNLNTSITSRTQSPTKVSIHLAFFKLIDSLILFLKETKANDFI